jgi:hypothetical protein
MGFGISLVSVVINVFILAGINDRIKEADGELSKLTTSLSNQATEMNRAEVIESLYKNLNHLSRFATGEAKKSAEDDSIFMLQSYLQKTYAAVNDIPSAEMKKAENEELSGVYEYMSKVKDLQKARDAGNTAEAARLDKETDEIEKTIGQPKSELGKQLAETVEVASPEKLADKSTSEVIYEISPYLKKLNEQYIVNYQKKEARIKELQEKKANLSWWASIATYLAVSLQLFGLMFVLTKDLTKDVKERREKAEKEAKKAEEEAALAMAEAEQAKEEAQEYREEAKEAREDAEEAREDAQEARQEAIKIQQQTKEARDLLAELEEELEEDLKSVVENVDKPNNN